MFFKKKKDKIQKVAEDKAPISHEGFKLTLHTEKDGKKFNKLSLSLGIDEKRLDVLNNEVNNIIIDNMKNSETAFNSIYMLQAAKICHTLEELMYVGYGIGQMTAKSEGGLGGLLGGLIHIQIGKSGKPGNQQEDEDNDNSIEALIRKSEKINGKYGESKKDDEEK